MAIAVDTRQKLINALAVVIAREGYGPSKIADIAREAKVSLRTFYAEFPSKEACFLALYEQLTAGLLQLNRSTVKFEDEWRHEIERGFAAHLRALTYEPRLTYAALMELANLSDEARQIRARYYDELATILVEQVDRGREVYADVASRPLSHEQASMIIGGISEMVVRLIVRGEIERAPELAAVATELLWSVITNTKG